MAAIAVCKLVGLILDLKLFYDKVLVFIPPSCRHSIDSSPIMATDGDGAVSLVDTSSAPPPSLSDPSQVIGYITRVVSSILEDDDGHPPSGGTSLTAVLNDSQDSIRKFIGDPMAKSLFVQKISNKGKRQVGYLVIRALINA